MLDRLGQNFGRGDNVPGKLYKYCSMRGDAFRYTQAILARHEIFFSPVTQFNDPFEGHFKLMMPADASLQQREVEGLANLHYNRLVASTAAVVALAERKDNILMWSHYADNHRGVCIEFDARGAGAVFSEARKVRYLREFKEVEHATWGDDRALIELVCTAKAIGWEYEREWRLVRTQSGVVSFEPQLITSVILGCRMTQDDRRWVRQWIDLMSHSPTLLEARQSSDSFGMTFEAASC